MSSLTCPVPSNRLDAANDFSNFQFFDTAVGITTRPSHTRLCIRFISRMNLCNPTEISALLPKRNNRQNCD